MAVSRRCRRRKGRKMKKTPFSTSPLPRALERDIIKACLDWAALMKIPLWRANRGGVEREYKGKRRFVQFGIDGQADLTGIFSVHLNRLGKEAQGILGIRLEVEVKVLGKDATPAQRRFLDRIIEAGGIGLVVHSFQEFQDGLKAAVGQAAWW